MYKFLTLAIFIGSSSAIAQDATKFVAVYTDKLNGLSWSKALPDHYSNGCVASSGQYSSSKCTYDNVASGNRQVRVEDSEAAKACRNIGARLPTKEEFESLIRNFDYSEEHRSFPQLTNKGNADMQAIFGDMDNYFWSSSVPHYNSNFTAPKVQNHGNAFIFGSVAGYGDADGGRGSVGLFTRNQEITVRCVSGN